MSGFANSIIGGMSTLIRLAIQSANYVAGIAGWRIAKDGSAELNNAVIRGSVVAGAGAVTLNQFGIDVKGGGLEYLINVSGGIVARKLPDDGSIAQLTDQTLFLNSPNPTPINALTLNDGYISATLNTNGSVETPQIQISGSSIQGKVSPVFTVWGQSSGSAIDDSFIEVNGKFKQGNLNAWAFATSNSGTFSSEAVLLTTVAANWLPNSVYQVKVRGRWQPSNNTTPRVVFRLRKTNVAGTTLIDWGRKTAISAEPYELNLDGLFQTGSSPLTNVALALTMASGSGAGVNDVSAIAPYYIEVLYYDDNTVYSAWLGTLT